MKHHNVRLMSIVIFATVCTACTSFNSASGDYAKQTELALQRQQAEPELVVPGSEKLHLDLIRKLQDRSMYFASLAHFQAYEKLYGTNPEVNRLHADSLRATGQAAAAEERYQQLLSSNEAAAAWRGLGLLAAQQANYAKAAALLQTSVQHDPTNATTLSDLGYALMRNDQIASARLPLLQAAELAPDSKKVISNVALYLMLTNDLGKAEALMTRAQLSLEIRQEILKQRNLIAVNEAPIALSQSTDHDSVDIRNNNGMHLETKLRTSPSKLR